MRSSSASDSTLKQRMPTSNARSISVWDLATPENTTLLASPPAAKTRSSSPCETISNPEPNLASKFNRAILGLDFTAKQIRCGCPCNAESRSEEHTSELQSRFDIVCRLLLE